MPLSFDILYKLKKGDKEAFQEFRDALEEKSIRALRRKGASLQEAKDLFVGAFLIILDRYDTNAIKVEHENFEAYFIKSLNGQFYNEKNKNRNKKEKFTTPMLQDPDEIFTALIEYDASYNEDEDYRFFKILELVNKALPDFRRGQFECDNLIRAHHVEDKSINEIARSKNLLPNTVSANLNRCLEDIRKLLTQQNLFKK